MKFKRMILLFLLFLLTTGCSVEYNLIINEDETINESFSVLQPNNLWGNNREEIEEQLYWTLVFAKDETEPAYFYNHEQILGDINSGVKYSYNFRSIEGFKADSEVLKNCFEDYDIRFDNSILQINLNEFKCEKVSGDNFDLKINIVVDGTAIGGNYDQKNGNKYTWNINSKDNVNIVLSLNTMQKEVNSDIKLIGIITLVVLIIIIGILSFAYIKNRRNNS